MGQEWYLHNKIWLDTCDVITLTLWNQYLQSLPEKLVWCLAYRVKFTGKEGGSFPGRPRKQKGRICPNLYYYRWILIVSSCLGFSVSRGFEKANKKYKSNKKNWTGFLKFSSYLLFQRSWDLCKLIVAKTKTNKTRKPPNLAVLSKALFSWKLLSSYLGPLDEERDALWILKIVALWLKKFIAESLILYYFRLTWQRRSWVHWWRLAVFGVMG